MSNNMRLNVPVSGSARSKGEERRSPSKQGGVGDALQTVGLNQARWQAVLDSAQDAIVSIDQHGAVTLVNRAAERIFGYPAEEVLGHNVTMLMPAPFRDEHAEYVARYERTGTAKAIGRIRDVYARRKSGEVFPIELSVSEARFGDEVLYSAIIRDVTERRRLEAASARLAAIVESSQAAIISKTLDGSIVSWNRGAETLYGYSADEIVGDSVSTIFPQALTTARAARRCGALRRSASLTGAPCRTATSRPS